MRPKYRSKSQQSAAAERKTAGGTKDIAHTPPHTHTYLHTYVNIEVCFQSSENVNLQMYKLVAEPRMWGCALMFIAVYEMKLMSSLCI